MLRVSSRRLRQGNGLIIIPGIPIALDEVAAFRKCFALEVMEKAFSHEVGVISPENDLIRLVDAFMTDELAQLCPSKGQVDAGSN